jgi:ABC-type sugar transport system permease subunit
MIYTTAFQQGDLGLASALGWSLFVLSFGIAFINLKIFRQQT